MASGTKSSTGNGCAFWIEVFTWLVLLCREPEERLRQFMRYCVSLGANRSTLTRSQFVRMPDGTRDNGKRQVVYYFDPEVIR